MVDHTEEIKKWETEENERRRILKLAQDERDKIQEERMKCPIVMEENVKRKKVCKRCGNLWNIVENPKTKELMICGRRFHEEKTCGCGQTLTITQMDIDRVNEPKKVMYLPPSHHSAPYAQDGLVFYPRTVQPVSDRVYDRFKHIHQFITIDEVKRDPIDYPPNNEEVLISTFSGDRLEASL